MPLEEKGRPARPHVLHMEERERLTVSAVEEILSFDEEELRLKTAMGPLLLRGSGLKVEHLDKSSGELAVRGEISELVYWQDREKRGFWARLLGG